ncbi:cell division protein FtsL [Veronia nyctiphanis]|uniref:Cell division protein FtsL n=1 Tax=Veronia nyctiphanis TaxID=1278244 RepID=A0A4Q0YPJ9_9GAMM|nr:cell division protein FtsL [Veronia nyctiphanis]RXJ72483.1 cell division protein FtsL [Veronia nyctiphanis]
MKTSSPGLIRQIAYDIASVGRVPLILMLLMLISAFAVVYVTQLTRVTIANQDNLLVEQERLEVEWRNLILEEHALSEHSRVESHARQDLDMVRPAQTVK